MTGIAYAVVNNHGRYCRFRSYSVVEFVDDPIKATLYARESDARKRASETHYHKRTAWSEENFKVARLTFAVTKMVILP